MVRGFDRDELLEIPKVARYLKVSDVTVYRWCKEGKLPCLKLGHSWRVRRSALEDFLERGERSATLYGQLRPFYRIPDNVLAIAQTPQMLLRLDATFFGVGEAHGGKLVKFHGPETGASIEELRTELEGRGLEMERLENEGRFLFVEESNGDHVEELRGIYGEMVEGGHTLWASFDWVFLVDLQGALEQQRKLTQFVSDRQVVVQTGMLEGKADEWPLPLARKAQLVHSATVWLSEAGLVTNRVAPVAEE